MSQDKDASQNCLVSAAPAGRTITVSTVTEENGSAIQTTEEDNDLSLSLDAAAQTLNDTVADPNSGDGSSVSLISQHELILLLAEQVRNHPCLYGEPREDEMSDKRSARITAWNTISKNVGLPPEECQKRFKNIRDRYVKALKEHDLTGSIPKWKYYALVEYLKPSVRKRVTEEEILTSRLTKASGPATAVLASGHHDLSFLSSLQATPIPTTPNKNSSIIVGETQLTADSATVPMNKSPPMVRRERKRKAPVLINIPPSKRLAGSTPGGAMEVVSLLNAGKSGSSDFDDSESFSPPKDHLDVYAASVACQMRQLSPQNADLAKLRIQQVLYEVKYPPNVPVGPLASPPIAAPATPQADSQ